MKRVIAINGSPRRDDSPFKPANTHKLLLSALEGAKSAGAETEIFNLYDILDWKGCRSCFACKGKKRLETCAVRDGLSPLLERATKCDALILGSPIYFADISGCMRSFFERLVYPHISYTNEMHNKELKTLFIYTMNRSHESAIEGQYQTVFIKNKEFLERVFDTSDYLAVAETYQWDYEKFPCEKFDGKQREIKRQEIFPQECDRAFALGRELVSHCSDKLHICSL